MDAFAVTLGLGAWLGRFPYDSAWPQARSRACARLRFSPSCPMRLSSRFSGFHG